MDDYESDPEEMKKMRRRTVLNDVQDFLRIPRMGLKSRQVKIHKGPLHEHGINGTPYESFLHEDYRMCKNRHVLSVRRLVGLCLGPWVHGLPQGAGHNVAQGVHGLPQGVQFGVTGLFPQGVPFAAGSQPLQGVQGLSQGVQFAGSQPGVPFGPGMVQQGPSPAGFHPGQLLASGTQGSA
ncbi:Sulfotransferase domain-containing protein [Artemisia annua]|uniref:Sulfotransferase domain-containing protein n=1 Tax=Artemisia annua TaxID=35608 RepID=A0A2U1P5X9_ARTAN|nr:Sulfotransferase domain-containing protein [Artemisia annua]